MGSSSVDTEFRLLVDASSSPLSRAIPLDIILPKSDGRRPVARHRSPPDVVLRLSPDTVLLLPENVLTLDRRPTLDRPRTRAFARAFARWRSLIFSSTSARTKRVSLRSR